ncbi:MAG: hypothetical protein Q7S86_00395 [bacterium]|nr:hypothetical protein [bacterium]
MTNPMLIEDRIKMLTGKGQELLCRRLEGFEPELIQWGKDEGTLEVGEATEICVTAVVEIRIVRKSQFRKKSEQ